jgi:hypothetical protein
LWLSAVTISIGILLLAYIFGGRENLAKQREEIVVASLHVRLLVCVSFPDFLVNID